MFGARLFTKFVRFVEDSQPLEQHPQLGIQHHPLLGKAHLTVLKHQQGRDIVDFESLLEFGLLIHIHLGKHKLLGKLICQVVDHIRHHHTGFGPYTHKFHQDRQLM